MNIVISFIDAIIDFFASIAYPFWNCSQKDMGIVKGKLQAPICKYRSDMKGNIIFGEDPRA